MNDATIAEQKKSLRENVRSLRQALRAETRIESSAKICQRFQTLDSLQLAERIAGFLAFDGEADPLEVMQWAFAMGKQVFVPMIVARRQPLLFAPWTPDGPMRKNSFGIDEPDVPRKRWITAQQLDFVITPLVAFDERGTRLGVGGGYYDRSFAFLNSLPANQPRPTTLIAFAFELQRVPPMARQPWDVPLDGAITEWNHYPF